MEGGSGYKCDFALNTSLLRRLKGYSFFILFYSVIQKHHLVAAFFFWLLVSEALATVITQGTNIPDLI